jgi:hypothetical protein
MTAQEFRQLMNPSVYMHVDRHLLAVVEAVRNSERLPPFQKLARRIVAHLAPETTEIVTIREAFRKLDKDNTGELTMEEMTAAVREAGYAISEHDMKHCFR